MSKGYKKEYIDKVKQKFNDVQAVSNGNNKPVGKPCNDSHNKVCKSDRVVKLG